MDKFWKQLKCLSINEHTEKMPHIHITTCHSALEKKKILQYATMRINLEDSPLSEMSQSQKDKCYISPPIYIWYQAACTSREQNDWLSGMEEKLLI